MKVKKITKTDQQVEAEGNLSTTLLFFSISSVMSVTSFFIYVPALMYYWLRIQQVHLMIQVRLE